MAMTTEGATPSAGLAGTRWSLRSVRVGSEGLMPVVPGSGATLTFGPDGGAAGSSGCNRFTAGYVLEGEALAFTPIAHTLRACLGPVAAQEAALFAALPLVARAQIAADGTLALLDAAGATLLLCAPGRDSVVGPWRATGINNGRGALVSSAETPHVQVSFGEDGRLTGSTGVNRMTASYDTTHPRGLRIGPAAVTRRAGSPEAMAVERELLVALQAVAAYELDGERLDLRDATGAIQVALIAVPAEGPA